MNVLDTSVGCQDPAGIQLVILLPEHHQWFTKVYLGRRLLETVFSIW